MEAITSSDESDSSSIELNAELVEGQFPRELPQGASLTDYQAVSDVCLVLINPAL